MAKSKNLFVSPWQLIAFLFKLLLAIFGLLIIKKYLPYITNKLVSIEQAPVGVRWTSILTAVFLGFGIKHLVSLIIWVTLFILLRFYPCPDPYVYILFYLFQYPIFYIWPIDSCGIWSILMKNIIMYF